MSNLLNAETALFQDAQDLVRNCTQLRGWRGQDPGGPEMPFWAPLATFKYQVPTWRCPGLACPSTTFPFPISTGVPAGRSGGEGTLSPGDSGRVLRQVWLLQLWGTCSAAAQHPTAYRPAPHRERTPVCHQCRGREPLLWLEDSGASAGPSPRDFLLASLCG